jgi:hypothetical protein
MKMAGGFLTRIFFLLSVLGFSVSASAQITANCSVGCYGPGLGSDGLANTVVGGPYSNVVSYRFRAKHSGLLKQIHVYLISGTAGYAAGTGGTIRVTVHTDDGTSSHNPSGTVLATYLLSNPLSATPSRAFPILVFSAPPSLAAGQIYHIVFTNVDASPSTNYLSVDALYQQSPKTPSQPTISDTDSAELLRSGNGSWAPRKGYTPILQLDFSDGWTEGVGYMEVWIGVPQAISGTQTVRQTLTISDTEKDVKSVAVRVARTLGSAPLTVRLEEADGTLIEQGNIPATAFPLSSSVSYGWAQYTFSTPHRLSPGRTYHLVLQAPSTSRYQAFPIRKGMAYNFKDTTYFPDGYAQFMQNGSWVGWTQWGATNRKDGDLQFYFELSAPAAPPTPTISSVAASAVTAGGATISWTTDQTSTTQVEYGTTTAYGSVTTIDATMVTNHSQALSGLSAGATYHYRVHSKNASGGQASSDDFTFTTLFSVSSLPVQQSIFTTQTPQNPIDTDNVAGEYGMAFTSSVPGQITGVRYWKSSSDTGTHTGRLWRVSDRALLATVTFGGGTSTGWQTQSFPSPVTIAANTRYVVTVSTPKYYGFTQAGLATAITNGPLSTVVGGNGVYGSMLGAFPTLSWANSNYFRDVVFVASP